MKNKMINMLPLILMAFLVWFNFLSCKESKRATIEFQSQEITLNDTFDRIASRLNLEVVPDEDGKDTMVYMCMMSHSATDVNYESCTVYFSFGRQSRKLGEVTIQYLFQQKITASQLKALAKEVPLLKEMKNGHLKVKKSDVMGTITADLDNKAPYPAVSLKMYK
ncbi:hypothetical protein [Chitinophaga flava]|uniref:Uncharacterized protein n=1 Tax=Chitinophaga flava TaxID=2259036 RepID=A0A365Y1T7_9BACT|nr:hypothetical protein [Chitinophaga flava]RBL92258.1 hypothetical protein DF182_06595 [Chitinophaga flava]